LGCGGGGVAGERLAESAVRPMSVVVALELAEYGCGVSLVDDQETVEEFAAEGADEAFGDGAGSMPAVCGIVQTVEAPTR
jgi:hypothetical protein